METKNKHTRKLLDKKTHEGIELFFEFAQLKNLYRQGWLKRGISKMDCETVADHSFGVALLGYTLAEEYRKDLDSNHVMKLGLFHEVGEIYAGDITPKDGVSLEDKSQREYESVKNVFKNMPNPDKYISLWQEFEEGKTPESIFVKQIDKLEMILQANLYERLDYTNLHEFFEGIQKSITSPELKLVLDDLLILRQSK
jgi:putative hydrolase of HD superfamily